MFCDSRVVWTCLDRSTVLNAAPVTELVAVNPARAMIAPRPPVVAVNKAMQQVTVHVLPGELRQIAGEHVGCLDVSGVDGDDVEPLISLIVAAHRVGNDLAPADAAAEIAADFGALDLLARPAVGDRRFSMATAIRQVLGLRALSQDTVARRLTQSCPEYPALDNLLACWTDEIARMLGSTPYQFWPRFVSFLDNQIAEEMRNEAMKRAFGYVTVEDLNGAAGVAAAINDRRHAA